MDNLIHAFNYIPGNSIKLQDMLSSDSHTNAHNPRF